MILDHDSSAAFNELLDARFRSGERRTHRVGANADYQHVPLRQVSGGKLVVSEEMRRNAQRLNGLGNMIACPHYVADAEVRRAGIDLVETAPDYDPAGITAILAAQLLLNVLGRILAAN